MVEVSVIVPNYNHARFLPQRLESIFNQTFRNFEVILLDDASDDNSVEVLNVFSADQKVSSLVNSKNSGSTFKQWQKGISLAKGNYIWLAESDDYCALDFLEKIMGFIAANDDSLGLVYTQTSDVDNNSKITSDRMNYTNEFIPNIWKSDFVLEGKEFVTNYLKVKNVIPNASAVVFKKELVNQECFDESLLAMRMAGDWLFWIKLSQGTNIGFIAENLNFFRNHKDISRNHNSKKKMYQRVLEEKLVRTYLDKTCSVNQDKEWDIAYSKWFKVNNYFSLFKSGFYHPKSDKLSVFDYIKKFTKFLKQKSTK